MKCLSCLLVLFICNAVLAKKDAKFRMEKLNFVWSKAMSQLEDAKSLDKLQKDLATFDGFYLSQKQDKSHVKKGHKAVDELDAKLEALLQRYDLEDTVYAFRMKYKYDQSKTYSEDSGSTNKYSSEGHSKFEDPRVIKLWEAARDDRSLTLAELDDIYYELAEHEQKLQEYKELFKQLSEREKLSNHVHKEQDGHKEGDGGVVEVKRLNQQLEDNLTKIEKRLDDIKNNPFKNTKVRRLWERAAKSTRLIPNELDAIKAELRHFDKQLEKINYHREQLNDAEEFSHGKKGTEDLRDEHEHLARKIKKLEHYLDEKIASVHSEL